MAVSLEPQVNFKGLLLKCYSLVLLPRLTFQVAKVLKDG